MHSNLIYISKIIVFFERSQSKNFSFCQGASAQLTGVEKWVQGKKTQRNAESFFLVPGAGIEPARIAPLVFETSASTDSAIRAG